MGQKQTGKETLKVGIDLGTSRSAISASNGKKAWVESYVGWPKDFISQKVLGKRVVFGLEAMEHRLSLDIHRPLENGVIKDGAEKDVEAVKELIHHLIDLVKPKETSSIQAVVGMPAECFKTNKKAIKEALAEYADSVMLISEPFAVAYGLNALDNSLIIDIGAGTVDFCIMHGAIPTEEDQRTVFSAGDHIDKQLWEHLKERYPQSSFNMNMVRRFKEDNSFVGGPNGRETIVKMPINGKPTDHEISGDIKSACESILPSIIETTLELISKFDPEYQERIRNNVKLAGGGSQIKGLREYIQRALNEFSPSKVECVEDPLFGGADGALALATDMPEQYWAQA